MHNNDHFETAKDFWNEYLTNNIESSHTLKRMRSIIEEFKTHAARLIVTKCIDGRVHGSKGKGYPPTTAVFSRSEGNNIETDSSNFFFWRRIDEVVIDASRNTPGKPALFIALGHYAVKGHGCAAHGEDNEKALNAVREQASRVKERYSPDKLYAIYGMTNTDDSTEVLHFGDQSIDAGALIDEFALTSASDVFQKEFLEHKLEDATIERFLGDMTPADILEGPHAAMFADLQTALAMESFFIHHVSNLVEERVTKNTLVHEQLFEKVLTFIDNISEIPPSLKGALVYQILWNVAQGAYQRERIASMSPEEQKRHLEHNESVVAYGEGYEAKNRNSIILVKPGRGDDRDALKIARKVLENNRAHSEELAKLPPLVHINVELVSAVDSWQALNAKILSELRSRLRIVREVFGDDVHVLTTYSYRSQKLFYPVRVDDMHGFEHERKMGAGPYVATDLAEGLNEHNFSPTNFKDMEEVYALGGI